MGFIAYQLLEESTVRIFMECEDEGEAMSYTQAVNVHFGGPGSSCRLSEVDNILALKKFYKLVFSLEERARERGHDWRSVFTSRDKVIEHLEYTRNVRRLASGTLPRVRVPVADQLPTKETMI
jgi:hypothetical protein